MLGGDVTVKPKPKPSPDVSELRIGDILTFLAVARSASLTAAARERKVTPSQVSKAITRLEAHFSKKLLERGSRGVVLTEAGHTVAPSLEGALAQLDAARGSEPDAQELTLGAPSYLQAALLPVVASAAPNLRVRAFELPAALLRANAHDEGFDVLLLPGEPEHLPPAWVAETFGELRKAVFASPPTLGRLGRPPISPEALSEIAFVTPVFKQQGLIVPVDDGCPLPRQKRKIGHQVQTVGVALEIAAQTSQLVFGPVLAARRHLRAGSLVEVPVTGWDPRETLTFACHEDRISAKLRSSLMSALRTAMRTLDA